MMKTQIDTFAATKDKAILSHVSEFAIVKNERAWL